MQTSQTLHFLQADRRSQTTVKTEPTYYTAVSTLIFTGLFGLTAVMGVWVAYDHLVALQRFAQMLVGFALLAGIPFYCRQNTRFRLAMLGSACGWLAGGLGIAAWFITAHGNPGAVASSIAVLLPLAVASAIIGRLNQHRALVLTSLPLGIAILGLILSFEHSAWLSAFMGLICSTGFYYSSQKDKDVQRQRTAGLFVLLLTLLLFVLFWTLLYWPPLVSLLAYLPLGDSLASRVDLWRNTLTLIRDYPFTGSGLGVSAMVYSTYVYLLHVPYFYHAHHLFLQIGVEQGLPGLIAFVGMLVTAFYGLLATHTWRSSTTLRLLYSASFGSLVTLVVYGLLDTEIYVQLTLPIMFVPLGFALALQWRIVRDLGVQRSTQMRWDGWLLIGAPWLLLVGMMVWPGALAAMQADLGAVAQTKAELSRYHWPMSKLQDDLRRRHAVDLEQAFIHYRSALAVDPYNVTAYRRLGQVALAEGDVVNAEKYLQQALAANSQDRATRQLLGEIYAISGKIDQAIALWQTIDIGQGQLEVRAWWYNYIGAQREAALFAEALQRLKGGQVING